MLPISLEKKLEAFESEWSQSRPESFDEYIVDVSSSNRLEMLSELIMIDLELRYQADRDSQLIEQRLAEFFDRYPDLESHATFHQKIVSHWKSLQFKKHTITIQNREKESTQDKHAARTVPSVDSEEPQDVEWIGRYRIEDILGKGSFGLVYLAYDEQLDRPVAVKVPHARLISRPDDAEAYLTEARTVASLDHPHIVPVFDVGSTEKHPCFIVSKYIEGTDLTTKIKQQRLTYNEAAELVATVAEALHYAHLQGLVHRDVKPGNIMVSRDGTPYVVDFGLALREENIGHGPQYVGTPAYMSPEQAQGEGHRVDGRSDIYSLGVVFYELLTGRRTFSGEGYADILEQIVTQDPKPPRQIDDAIPKELERICLKALSRSSTDRFTMALDMADDLRHSLEVDSALTDFNGTPAQRVPSDFDTEEIQLDSAPIATESQSIKIIPKGLRSFDAHDSDFFLELLPGPCDRDGLPESLRFWKTRIEETDPDNTFPVGLIYGPSGCGKTSLVKAGLLPRLNNDVISVYIEATPDDTTTRLLHGLRKHCPALGDGLSLKETLAALRRGRGLPVGKKVLIVLDQFEQCLHTRNEDANTDLVQALRQCDGGRVQCIVMLRDDFWMAATRFMRELEVRLVEAQNSAAVDLFPVRHAEKVLAAFGRAFGTLPKRSSEFSKEQKAFLQQSVTGLAEDEKVISVRLALFAEMMKGKPWTPATLKQVGGTKGVGVTFLEETFIASTAPPEHRYHQKAACAVLKSLLPESGADIKGQMKSYGELLEASGYAHRPRDFDDLIRILDSEIRLITPTDPEGVDRDNESKAQAEVGKRYFQLTHDYLVRSLRDWLSRKQKETRRGRAELLLSDRAAVWEARPENRQLPSLLQWIQIQWFTEKKNWTSSQRKMMRRTSRHQTRRGVTVALLLAVTMFTGSAIWRQVDEQQRATHNSGLVDSLFTAEIAQVPNIVSDIDDDRDLANPLLRKKIAEAVDGSSAKLHLALALLPVDETQLNYLGEQLTVCSLQQLPIVRAALAPHKDSVAQKLWQRALDEELETATRFQVAATLAEYASSDKRWGQLAPLVATHLTTSVSSVDLGQWLQLLQPARMQIAGSLVALHADRSLSIRQRETAANTLSVYLKDQPEKLVECILFADELAEFSHLITALKPHSVLAKKKLITEMQAPMPEHLDKLNDQLSDGDQQLRDALWRKQSLAAVALLHLGFVDEMRSSLELTPDPSLRSYIIHHLGQLGTNPNTIAAQLLIEEDVSIRRALIQSLGGLDPVQILPADRSRITDHLLTLFMSDPDPGIHGSASWALRQWGATLPDFSKVKPQLSPKQRSRVAELILEVDEIRQQLAVAEQELPQRQAAWERNLSEQPTELTSSLSDGLVAHYALDESRGTETANVVNEQQVAEYVDEGTGQPEWVPGVVGNAVRLNGKGGRFDCGLVFNPEYTDAFSYGGWFLSETEKQNAALLGTFDADNHLRGFNFWCQTTLFSTNFIHKNNFGKPDHYSLKVMSYNPLSGGQWHHLFATYDGSSTANGMSLFVDGNSVPTHHNPEQISKTIQSNAPLYLGGRGERGGYTFHGCIDEVRIYNRQLSESEVRQLYESGVQALTSVANESRTIDQQEILTRIYRPLDEPLEKTSLQLTIAEKSLHQAEWNDQLGWYVNGQGQTMVELTIPASQSDSHLDHRFAIASHEVTVAEFLEFREDHVFHSFTAPTEDCPAHYVTWYQAAEYCNWLSNQEGIPKDQWVYQPNQEGNYAEGMLINENALELRGYRLPTDEEWGYACRASTEGTFAFGELKHFLPKHAQCFLNSSGRTHPVESLLPNDVGLFDFYGNVWEWAHTPWSGKISPVTDDGRRTIRGGSFIHLGFMRSEQRYRESPSIVMRYNGFRLARTFSKNANHKDTASKPLRGAIPRFVRKTTLSGHTDKVFGVVWSHTGEMIASSSYDGTNRLWSAKNGFKMQSCCGRHLAFSSLSARARNHTLLLFCKLSVNLCHNSLHMATLFVAGSVALNQGLSHTSGLASIDDYSIEV